MAVKGLAEGVDRAGADIAEDDADRAHGEADDARLRMMLACRPVGGQLWCGAIAHLSGTNVRLSLLVPRYTERRAH